MGFLPTKRTSALFLIPLLSIVAYKYGFDKIPVINNFTTKAVVVDSIQFVSSWPPTYCRGRACITPLPTNFIIHGLWPADKIGVGITDCPTSETTSTLLNWYTRIGGDLATYWPTIIKGQANAQFWDAQWFKHGSCSKLTPGVFFRAGIDQKKNIDLKQVLIDGGVKPSPTNTYTRAKIISAVQKKIGAKNHIYMACKPGGGTVVELNEIVICLDTQAKNYKPCPQDDLPRGCNDKITFAAT